MGKKLIDAATWTVDYASDCGGCRDMYENRNPPERPPCNECRIEPFDENKDPIRIFFIIRNQFIMGANGPIDINHLAIDAAMKREGIKGADCFNRVLKLADWWLSRIRNNARS